MSQISGMTEWTGPWAEKDTHAQYVSAWRDDLASWIGYFSIPFELKEESIWSCGDLFDEKRVDPAVPKEGIEP